MRQMPNSVFGEWNNKLNERWDDSARHDNTFDAPQDERFLKILREVLKESEDKQRKSDPTQASIDN